jgi:hypothetical protein
VGISVVFFQSAPHAHSAEASQGRTGYAKRAGTPAVPPGCLWTEDSLQAIEAMGEFSRRAKIENPRVGSSILSLGTIKYNKIISL